MGQSSLSADYEIVRVVARGGMAEILEARDRTGRAVAIKLLREGLSTDADIRARFYREARMAASLRSRHVARIFDFGTNDNDQPFIAMELLAGNDLSREIRQRGALPLEEAASYVAQACHAMIEAHDAGIVHRDLKPPNLFLAKEGSTKRVLKVLDFGISKISKGPGDGHITLTQTLFGSPLYMSPETFQSAKAADARSDIWSLGVIFYEMLTGAPPFDAENALAIGFAVTRKEPIPPTERRAYLPRAADVVIARALKKDPDERYQTMRELLAAIEVFLPLGRNETMMLQRVSAPDTAEDPRSSSPRDSRADEPPTRVAPRESRADEPATRVVVPEGSATEAFAGLDDSSAQNDPPTRVAPRDAQEEQPTRVAAPSRNEQSVAFRASSSELDTFDGPTRVSRAKRPEGRAERELLITLDAPRSSVDAPRSSVDPRTAERAARVSENEDFAELLHPNAAVDESDMIDPPTWVRSDAPRAAVHAAIKGAVDRARTASDPGFATRADTARAVNLSTPDIALKPGRPWAYWVVPVLVVMAGGGIWWMTERSRGVGDAPASSTTTPTSTSTSTSTSTTTTTTTSTSTPTSTTTPTSTSTPTSTPTSTSVSTGSDDGGAAASASASTGAGAKPPAKRKKPRYMPHSI